MTKICFDYDPLLYAAACIGEKKSVKVVHKASGREIEFPNRTAFYGHWKAKKGGWLAETNKSREAQGKTPWLPEEFDYIDVVVPEPIEWCIKTLKNTIQAATEAVGTKSYFGYSGEGQVFRVDKSTIIKYKGNRDDLVRPVHLPELKDYLVRQHNCKIIREIEADDMCSIASGDAYRKWLKSGNDADKLVLCAVDKDYDQCPAHILHPFNLGPLNSHDGSFGYLHLDASTKPSKVTGRGRMWLYFQVMNGDDADNYFANSASPVKWATMSAYDVLKDCKTDKEAFQALVRGYKVLYPQPKKIIGWRGDEIEIDWLYVLQENFTMAMMLRKLGDSIDVKQTLVKLGVEF